MKSISVGYLFDVIFIVSFFNAKSQIAAAFILCWILFRLFLISSKLLDELKIESIKSIKKEQLIQLIVVMVLLSMAIFFVSNANSKFNFF
jgi:hypothetical protein